MLCIIPEYSKCEVRRVIKFLQAEGVSKKETDRRLHSVYGLNVLSRKEVSVRSQRLEQKKKKKIQMNERN